jgi:hypothetical protein
MTQAPESNTRCTVLLDRYFLIPFLFCTYLFPCYIDPSLPSALEKFKSPEVYFGPCLSRGPLVRAYK